ncbi:hypothetical protein A0H81_13174 [Grifola frondosa]|uniref:Uncharacterized protein n=1 Tax=Grifola frondosa TaxID=5627 RepID=A0A1C7LPS5_GRIFR|nr:hypothetical protein A0H81_13174 [Grifola frondosa]
MAITYYSYKAHRYYPQVGNRGKGQNFGIVGLERPDEPPTTYAFVLRESDLVQVTEVPRTRRNKKTSVSGRHKESALKTRILPPSIPRPRTKRTSNSARKAHRQKRAPGDHPSTDTLGTRAVPGELQQPTHIPSLAHQPSAVDLQCALYDPTSGIAARQQSLPTVDVLRPYMHPKPVQSAYSPVTPPFQELLLPPCQSAPSTMVADNYAMAWASNFATPSALFSSPVRPTLVVGGYQSNLSGVPGTSGSIPNHLHPNIAPQTMQMRQQLHDCLAVLDHPQMFDVATSPAQMEQQPIYYPPGTFGTNEDPPPPHVFDESMSAHLDTHQVLVQTAHRLPRACYECRAILCAADTSICSSMWSSCGITVIFPANSNLKPATPPDYTDSVTEWKRSIHRVDIKNDVAPQQMPYESRKILVLSECILLNPYSRSVYPNSLRLSHLLVRPAMLHPSRNSHWRVAILHPPTRPRIARSSRGTSRLNLAVDKWNDMCDMQLNVADGRSLAQSTSSTPIFQGQTQLQQPYKLSGADMVYGHGYGCQPDTWSQLGSYSAQSKSFASQLSPIASNPPSSAGSIHEWLHNDAEVGTPGNLLQQFSIDMGRDLTNIPNCRRRF